MLLRSLVLAVCLVPAERPEDDSPEKLLQAARAALSQGMPTQALELARRAEEKAPREAVAPYLRGAALEALGKLPEAVAAYSRAVQLDRGLAAAYNARGGAHFKQGQITESLADFDRFLELRPEKREDHWQRGISLYYAGRYVDGREQFKLGEKVFGDDVENAAWHYLCNARATTPAQARAELLKVGRDARIPLMEIYALFAGKATAEDVLKAAQAGEANERERRSRLFYAHLYLGIYHEAHGNARLALEHLGRAARDYRIGHYMGDVARVHHERLLKGQKESVRP